MRLTNYIIADHLQTEEDVRLYLEAAFEDGDPELVKHAIAEVASKFPKGGNT